MRVTLAPQTVKSKAVRPRVSLSMELALLLGLRDGQMLDLVPPARRGIWLLDTQARIGTPLSYCGGSRPQFRMAHHVGKEQMTVCRNGAAGFVCEVRSTLILELQGEDPDRPGVYRFKAR